MIKYFCDRCGKEISGGKLYADKTFEEVCDSLGNVVTTYASVVHSCEECRHEDLSYGFKVGDKVITSDGRFGYITEICTCESCANRGFYEPTVTFEDGTTECIMISDKNDGFKSYYQIGKRKFGDFDAEYVDKQIEDVAERYRKLVRQKVIIKHFTNGGNIDEI